MNSYLQFSLLGIWPKKPSRWYFVRMYHGWRFTDMFSSRWTRDSILLKLANTDNKLALQKRFVLIHLQTSTYLPYACSWNYRPFFLNPLPTLVHLRPWQIARTVLGFLLQRVGNGHGEVGVWIPPQSRKENRPMGVKASFYRKRFYKYPVLLGLWARSFSCLQSRKNLRWLRLLKLINTSDHDACMHTKLRTVFVVTYFSTTTNHKILQFLSWYFYPTIDPVFTTHGFKQTLYNYGLWSFPILEGSQETFWDTPMTARISLGKMR